TLRVSSGVPINFGNVQLVGMTRKDLEKAMQIRKISFACTTKLNGTCGQVYYLPQDIIDNTRRASNTCIPGSTSVVSGALVVTCSPNGYDLRALSGGVPGTTIPGGDPTGRYIAPAGSNCISSFTGQCGITHLIIHGPRFTRLDLGIEKKIKFSETK